jgi:chromosome segregation ATPase
MVNLNDQRLWQARDKAEAAVNTFNSDHDEERRKMAWQLAQTMVARRDDIPMDRVAQAAWKVVDAFLENEGGVEVEKLTKQLEEARKEAKGWHQQYNAALDDLLSLATKIAELNTQVEKVTEERDALRDERDSIRAQFKQKTELSKQEYEGALKAADYWKGNYDTLDEDFDLLTKERDELKAENSRLNKENSK